MTPQQEQAQIAQADRLDAEGRHDDAINILSRAASQGGVEAKARVGARILLGDRAPFLGPQGAGLLAEAASEGSGQAAQHMSILCAAGVFRPRDWAAGLDWLLRAAQAGLGRARGELAVLAGEPAAPDGAGAPESAADLAALRASIDPAALTAAPAGQTLHSDPAVTAFPGFAGPAVCAWMIARAGTRLKRAEIYNPLDQKHQEDDSRTNTLANFSLLDTDLVFTAMQSRIAAAASIAFNHLEGPTVLHYSVGEQFRDHFDFIDPRLPDHDAQIARDGQRIATFLIYLNEDYEGGATDFPRMKVQHKGGAGEGLLFVNALPDGKADIRTLHAGRAPTAGEKWLFSQFIRSRPALPGAEGGGFFRPGGR